MTFRVVHTIAGIRSAHGGPSRSVPRLCDALAGLGVEVALVTRDASGEEDGGEPLMPSSDRVEVDLARQETGPLGAVRTARRFDRLLAARLGRSGTTIVHDHGAWLKTNHSASVLSARYGALLVVSPRGMLSAWALGQGRLRKRLAWGLYQRRTLERAALIHATAEAEADDVWALGLTCPVAVVPNGVELPDRRPAQGGTAGGRRLRTVLFLSRFHPKKGLKELVDAWAEIPTDGWELLLAGPDEDGYRGEIERRVEARGVGDSVRFGDAVDDDAKWDLYRRADLFVLPSRDENFGIVVGEALASGLPVVTTRGTPWSDVVERDCGWWIGLGVDPLKRALREAMEMPDERRREMGERGRFLIEERYAWDRTARRLAEAYAWIAGLGDRPDCVREAGDR